ncbi:MULTISPECIES: hypothetical protein [Komagataeibacter]|uniref:hypothetical protein n=1 Tax=Komagataeibacter TaxID=1434011 RepID=UPI001C2C6EC3|nr:hypothetical protein [Komagataeibacter oboediens]MBV0888829.1 hypothetical protein [Komagataeibacter oboediens]MCK9821525.1 hypothetical protein [Komagataeibacter oboediens]
MSDYKTRNSPHYAWASFEAIRIAGERAREIRAASGEIVTYVQNGWVVREFPGGQVERLAPLDEFRDEDFPYPA